MRLRRIAGDGAGIQCLRIDVHARAQLDDVGDREADDQRQGGEEQEIAERLCRDPADRLQLAKPSYAADQGQEDDGRDDHLHQLDEAIAERLEGLAGGGVEVAEEGARKDREENLEVEVGVPGARGGVCGGSGGDHG